MTGLLVAFALGAVAGGLVAALLLWAVLMAERDEDGDRGDYRAGGGWR